MTLRRHGSIRRWCDERVSLVALGDADDGRHDGGIEIDDKVFEERVTEDQLQPRTRYS